MEGGPDSSLHSSERTTDLLLEKRGNLYGGIKNLELIAQLQDVYLRNSVSQRFALNARVMAHDSVMLQVLVKIARIATGEFHEDNYDDAIGYLKLAKRVAKGENF